jgi:hypothetical protein
MPIDPSDILRRRGGVLERLFLLLVGGLLWVGIIAIIVGWFISMDSGLHSPIVQRPKWLPWLP